MPVMCLGIFLTNLLITTQSCLVLLADWKKK